MHLARMTLPTPRTTNEDGLFNLGPPTVVRVLLSSLPLEASNATVSNAMASNATVSNVTASNVTVSNATDRTQRIELNEYM